MPQHIIYHRCTSTSTCIGVPIEWVSKVMLPTIDVDCENWHTRHMAYTSTLGYGYHCSRCLLIVIDELFSLPPTSPIMSHQHIATMLFIVSDNLWEIITKSFGPDVTLTEPRIHPICDITIHWAKHSLILSRHSLLTIAAHTVFFINLLFFSFLLGSINQSKTLDLLWLDFYVWRESPEFFSSHGIETTNYNITSFKLSGMSPYQKSV